MPRNELNPSPTTTKRSPISADAFKRGTRLDSLERRVGNNERKITSIKNIIILQKSDLPEKLKSIEPEESKGLGGIKRVLNDILGVLRLRNKDSKREASFDRKERERQKRIAREDKIEKKDDKKSAPFLKKMVAPFESIWDKIIKFIKLTLIGFLFNKVLKWFMDPKNQQKIETIGKFLKDWWPALVTAAALFLTPFGAFVKGTLGLLTTMIPRLLMAIKANPYAAAGILGAIGGGLLIGASKSGGEKTEQLKSNKGDSGVAESRTLSRNRYSGGISTPSESLQKMEDGGQITGPSHSQGGVPVEAEGGEVMMSNEAGDMWGRDLLVAMNEAAGGATDPMLMDIAESEGGPQLMAKDGGLIPGGTPTSSGRRATSGSSGTAKSSGPAGSSGTAGSTGNRGTSGSSGTRGTSGSSGTPGSSGTRGTSGSSGTPGSSGTAGSTGNPGTSGLSGTRGTSGSSGTPGSSGTAGSTGNRGTSGSSGTPGSSGTAGSSGTPGSSDLSSIKILKQDHDQVLKKSPVGSTIETVIHRASENIVFSKFANMGKTAFNFTPMGKVVNAGKTIFNAGKNIFNEESFRGGIGKVKDISTSQGISPVDTPVIPQGRTINTILPPIDSPSNRGKEVPLKPGSDLPHFDIVVSSSYRSLVVSALGIDDLVGG